MGKNIIHIIGQSAAHMYGIIARPYMTMRSIAQSGSYWELVSIGVVLSMYFAVATVVKNPAFRPFLLTRQFLALAVVVVVTTLFASGVLWCTGKLVGGVGSYGRFFLTWSYTLIPTVCWFLATSILYILLPPPRTARPEGIAASGVFLVFSTVLLLWKLVLSYLAIRFSLRLSLPRILGAAFLACGPLFLYGYWTYAIGVFKIPFY